MEAVSTSTALQGAAAIAAVCALYLYLASPLRHIPGPLIARFTNIWRTMAVRSGRAEWIQRRLHDRYGPAVRMGPNMVSLSDPQMIAEVYSRKKLLKKSDMYSVNDLNVGGRRVPNVFSTRDEEMNAQAMKPVIKLFSMGSVLRMEPLVDSTISYFLEVLDRRFAATGMPCAMHDYLHYCAWDVVGDITFTKRMGFLERGMDVDGMLKMGYDAMDYFSAIGQMPWLDMLLDKNPVKRIGPPFFVPAVNFALEQIARRRSGADSHDAAASPDFLDGFLEAQQRYPAVVTDDIVLSYTMINVAAGSDTVATELRSILYHLCRRPETMARLRAELDASGHSTPLSWAACQELPFLGACVEEGVRLMPGISLPLERIVGADGMLLADGKTYLPPGTAVGISPWVVNRDATAFGVDPHGFRPERWLPEGDEDAAAHRERVGRMRAADLTFGYGKRQCAGRSLALLECHKIIGSLVLAFDVELADPHREWTTQNSWFIRQSDMDMVVRKR